MINISYLRTSSLKETALGSLFLPVAENGERFLAGRINDIPVLVVIDGDAPYHVGETETWSRASGLVLEGSRFEVEPQSAQPIQSAHDAPPGCLVLAGSGLSVIAHDRYGPKAVLLAGGTGSTGLEKGDVAFTKWRIVTGEGLALAVHFEHGEDAAGV